MLFKVFSAQWKYPIKDDWTNTVQKDLKDLEINMSLEEIKLKSKISFKKLVKIKAKEYTMDYLLTLKEKHTKMENLHYKDLKLQSYLKDKEIPTNEAKNLYKYRTRSAKFKENCKSSYLSTACPLCFIQLDTQAHCVQCPEIIKNMKIEGNYSDIFGEKIPSNISRTLLKISKFRENLL